MSLGMETADSEVIAQLDRAFAAGGFMIEIAQAALVDARPLEPDEAADIIMPPKATDGKPLLPRYQLVDGAKAEITAAAKAHYGVVFEFAEAVGMRQAESLPDSD